MPNLNLPTPGVTSGPLWATQLNTDIQAINTVVDALSADTGWVDISSQLTAASGFYKASGFGAEARRVGSSVTLRVFELKKSAGSPTLSIPLNGDISNTPLLTGVPLNFRPSRSVPLSASNGGRANSYFISTAGEISLTAMIPSADQTGSVNCPTDETFSCGGSYFA